MSFIKKLNSYIFHSLIDTKNCSSYILVARLGISLTVHTKCKNLLHIIQKSRNSTDGACAVCVTMHTRDTCV